MESSKEQLLFEVEFIDNSVNISIVTVDQFNASLLDKSINFSPKNNVISSINPNVFVNVCVCACVV